MNSSAYDKFPVVPVPGAEEACVTGWGSIVSQLHGALAATGRRAPVLVVDCYPGVDEESVVGELERGLRPVLVVWTRDAWLAAPELERLCRPFLGGNDPVFGSLCDLTLPEFFDPVALERLRSRVRGVTAGSVLVVGAGASLVAVGDVLVYADLTRWEIQQRQRRHEVGNLGVAHAMSPAGMLYKRAFFIDWRVADRWKLPLLSRCDYLLDTNDGAEPKLATGGAFRRGLEVAARRPFRVVPFFDPGPWGGQWMKRVCGLDPAVANYAWCFDCVPEENGLRLGMGSQWVEVPALDLVLRHPRELLGVPVQARFGDEFPIRFDLLDTMEGGNLSLQVHPLEDYIRSRFGMRYTQDESYYLLDAGEGASVFLGFREGVDPAAVERGLREAQLGGAPFEAERYVNRWPARRHDHFLIPAGTIHCSGRNSLVLEVSATPYLFTFKLWDWGRMGLDGKPRPIHLEHGLANLQWDRTTRWVERELINRIVPVASGDGWREERTGLHASEFIETRRHWFTGRVPHDTGGVEAGGVRVFNLVEGEAAVVESPDGLFPPFEVHFAETVIVPAAVGPYTIRALAGNRSGEAATLTAWVRSGSGRGKETL